MSQQKMGGWISGGDTSGRIDAAPVKLKVAAYSPQSAERRLLLETQTVS